MSITLFNNITEELTELEKTRLVPILLDILKGTTELQRITGHQLCIHLRNAGYQSVSDVRIRKMVNYIRQLNLVKPAVLIGAGNGYFITRMQGVVEKQIESLQGRVDSQNAVIDALKAQLESLKRKPI